MDDNEIYSFLKSLFDSKDLKIEIGRTERSIKATLYYKDKKVSTVYKQHESSYYDAYNLYYRFYK